MIIYISITVFIQLRGDAIYNLAYEQEKKKGHEIHVITSLVKIHPIIEEMNGIIIHRIKSHKLVFNDIRIPQLKKMNFKADVLHAHIS